jgi:2,4-dienoyl-CoA reductase-like NADH-dependent reductase (Old Yellow Enzyme family)
LDDEATASMLNLLSPLTLGRLRLPNRIALSALPSGFATPDGFVGGALSDYYVERARGGAGMLIFEHTYALPPSDSTAPHLGLYADAQVANFHHCIAAIHHAGAAALVMLDQPLALATLGTPAIDEIGEAFIAAAWRARAAGADGVMLSTADGGPFEQLVSPLQNRRDDRYGADSAGRLRLLLAVAEGIQKWIGELFVVGVRLNVEEFTAGGLTLQDARVIAKRLIGAGVRLLEISAKSSGDTPIARFPGWLAPLAAGIKTVVEVPVLVGSLSDDPKLADGLIRDGSADLAALNEALRKEPLWPQRAQAALIQAAVNQLSATLDEDDG